MKGRVTRLIVAGSLLAGVAGMSTAAVAKDGDVIRQGACSGNSDWKLKLSPENGKIEVEYEVDSNRNGQTWAVKIFKNGNRIFNGTRTTKAPSGSFEVRLVTGDPAGSDTFRAKAVNKASGENCVGTATF